MRSRILLALALATAAQAQYYYTDNFASYNSGAWAYPGGGAGIRRIGADFHKRILWVSNRPGGDERGRQRGPSRDQGRAERP